MRQTEGAAALALLDRGLIDADSPSPLYFQLYTVLHDAIVKGVLPNESHMPSEKELADGFNVSRITARRTLVELVRLSCDAHNLDFLLVLSPSARGGSPSCAILFRRPQ